jgi:molybdopterin converting factor small subunit
MVKVRFYGQFRKAAGVDSRELQNAAGLSLRELLARAGAGTSSPNLVSNLLVNGRNCMFLQGLDTVVKDGDVVDVLPVVGGG